MMNILELYPEKKDLIELCRFLAIKGYSGKTVEQLIELLKSKGIVVTRIAYYSLGDLAELGWTSTLRKRYGLNPERKHRVRGKIFIQLFGKEAINELIDLDDELRNKLAKVLRERETRIQAGTAAYETRYKNKLEYLEAYEPTLNEVELSQPIEKLVLGAIRYVVAYRSGWAMNPSLTEKVKISSRSSPVQLAFTTLNWMRHSFTDYEDALEKHRAITGSQSLYQEIKEKCNQRLSAKFPSLVEQIEIAQNQGLLDVPAYVRSVVADG